VQASSWSPFFFPGLVSRNPSLVAIVLFATNGEDTSFCGERLPIAKATAIASLVIIALQYYTSCFQNYYFLNIILKYSKNVLNINDTERWMRLGSIEFQWGLTFVPQGIE
jgi:hypothetical protein